MISQRSVGRLMRLLNAFFYRPPNTLALLSWLEYRTRLYEEGVDNHVLDNIEYEYGKRPRDFLPAILDGTISAKQQRGGWVQESDKKLGQGLMRAFAEVALTYGLAMPSHLPEVRALAEELRASLEIDGYEVVAGKLTPAAMRGMNLQQEDTYLVHLMRAIAPSNLDVVLHHHNEADETFINGNWGAASVETRNFLVALMRGFRDIATDRGGVPRFQHGNDSGLIEDFQRRGLLSAEEKDSILKLWVLLSYSGPHVGIQDDARARLIRLQVLGLAQWMCLKFQAWEMNKFQPL